MPGRTRLKPEIVKYELIRVSHSKDDFKRGDKVTLYLASALPNSPIRIREGVIVNLNSIIELEEETGRRNIPALLLRVESARNIPPSQDGMAVPYKQSFAYEDIGDAEFTPRLSRRQIQALNDEARWYIKSVNNFFRKKK